MPAVEEMTSLSNSYQRVIEIKPIQNSLKQPNELDEKADIQKQEQTLDYKINQAERELIQAREEASQIKLAAEKEIEEMKDRWTEERSNLVSEAKNEGYQKGLTLGKEEAERIYKQKLEQANAVIEKANDSYVSIVDSSEETIVELALKCAEKILGQELIQSPEAFISVVKRAVKEVNDQPDIALYVHPDQYAYIVDQRDELHGITHSKANLSIYVSDRVESYSCIVQSTFGRIDASVDHQLHELRQVLYEVVNEGASDE